MTEAEKIGAIEALYAEAVAKIKALEQEQKEIAAKFVTDITNKKIETIRAELMNS